MAYSGENYEFLFSNELGGLGQLAMSFLVSNGVRAYRTKTTRAGSKTRVEAYPLYYTAHEVRAARAAATSAAQKKGNERRAIDTLTDAMDTNFTARDFFGTLTYAGDHLPSREEALRDIRNFLRRISAYRKKHSLPPLKYIYAIEYHDGDGRRVRVHHHIVMSGGVDRQVIKELWGKGRVSLDELEPENGTLEGLARYITKQGRALNTDEPDKGKIKRWQGSRNLKKPKVTISDTKMSRRKVERLAADVQEAAPQIFGRLFPGYALDSCIVKSSDFVSGAYIRATLHRDPEKEKRRRSP